MKFFVLLAVLALVAQGYASSRYTYMASGERQNGRPGSWNSDSSEETSSSYNNQKWDNWDNEMAGILEGPHSSSSSSNYQFQSSASQLPQAESFKRKINQRLNGSDNLASKPEVKRKLIKMAEKKLEECVTPSGESLDKHCVGRTTGQMMQLIAAVENVSRQPILRGHGSSSQY